MTDTLELAIHPIKAFKFPVTIFRIRFWKDVAGTTQGSDLHSFRGYAIFELVMKIKSSAVVVAVIALFSVFAFGDSEGHELERRPQHKVPNTPKLPLLPVGVTDLKFSDFFVHPAGPRGLEFTKKLQELDGKRVRILGYMVGQEAQTNGTFLLSPIPVTLHQHDDECFVDDLPAAVVRVISPEHAGKSVPHTPNLLLLTGTLSVGYKTEGDERSWVRLRMDPKN